jgi:signal transduction histidine kinase
MRVELEKKKIIVQNGLTGPIPAVMVHGGQLQQVILNLIRNAGEAMDAVSNRERVLRVRSAIHNTNEVLVSIEDSGPGIDPENINRIFEPFYTTKSDGMGMGLAICRSIIEAHQGRLWVSAGIQHGSVFRFTLPTGSLETELSATENSHRV